MESAITAQRNSGFPMSTCPSLRLTQVWMNDPGAKWRAWHRNRKYALQCLQTFWRLTFRFWISNGQNFAKRKIPRKYSNSYWPGSLFCLFVWFVPPPPVSFFILIWAISRSSMWLTEVAIALAAQSELSNITVKWLLGTMLGTTFVFSGSISVETTATDVFFECDATLFGLTPYSQLAHSPTFKL